ncbi:MAG: N-acetyl-gamma-glutamyl-phosphate reductase [Natronospirillum sp.]|uniref:N-acetyl-gamma-glutamyl-phosphate reductase n=1 Tax=Natronospirillum sp. TaxID=2812955 RepID=UPI0025FC885C|nr:N-acetyl-gamma-glutamyl-phosphate reductase [Natronospirillum sp.]MCH8551683.1 N-acetyl-gamma-glutamyl-phosphate reductase [Natronospirillum sp.]
MYSVFVDGQEGTTGLQIKERLTRHPEVELLEIDPEKRKDTGERQRLINAADIAFLCLPDAAAKESAALCTSDSTRLIDASTAHRVDPEWVFGLPELDAGQREKIAAAKRVANPGCHSTGFILLVRPLIDAGILPAGTALSCQSLTGYSGGGKGLIERYEQADEQTRARLQGPSHYALGLTHKHLPEMQALTGLTSPPVFTPLVGPYYKGMVVTVPLHAWQLASVHTAEAVHAQLTEHYADSRFVTVQPFDASGQVDGGFLNPQGANDTNENQIFVFGGDEHILLMSRLDNLGKGASGAAVQNMNIMLGLPEQTGL